MKKDNDQLTLSEVSRLKYVLEGIVCEHPNDFDNGIIAKLNKQINKMNELPFDNLSKDYSKYECPEIVKGQTMIDDFFDMALNLKGDK